MLHEEDSPTDSPLQSEERVGKVLVTRIEEPQFYMGKEIEALSSIEERTLEEDVEKENREEDGLSSQLEEENQKRKKTFEEEASKISEFGIINDDPYLKPFEGVIRKREEKFEK